MEAKRKKEEEERKKREAEEKKQQVCTIRYYWGFQDILEREVIRHTGLWMRKKFGHIREQSGCSLFDPKPENSWTLLALQTRPWDYKTIFMLISAEHEIFSANKYENANNSWHFHIY